MRYDEDTLNWLRDKTNLNILRYNQNNLDNISGTAKHELLRAGLVVRVRVKGTQNSKLQLTEKGRNFLVESEE